MSTKPGFPVEWTSYFFKNGSRAMTGDLSLGSNDITNTTKINGYTLPTDGYYYGQVLATDEGGNLFWKTVTASDGYVIGPASATDNAVARWNGTTGRYIQDSGVIIDDSGNTIIPNQQSLRLNEQSRSGTEYIGLRAPAAIDTSYTLTLPAAQGDANTALINNGSGTLSWSTVANYVVGPATATDNAIAIYNGTTGKLIQNSNATISDAGDGYFLGNVEIGNGLVFRDVDNSNFISLTSPTNITGSYELIYPAAQGGVNTTFRNDGSGNLSWVYLPTSYDGYVVGPASATDNAIVRFDGTTGKLVQSTAVAILDDSGNLSLGTTPPTSGIIRIPNNQYIGGRTTDGYNANILGLVSDNTIRLGMNGLTPWVYIGATTNIILRIGENNRVSVGDTFTTFNHGAGGNVVIGDAYLQLTGAGRVQFNDSDDTNAASIYAPANITASYNLYLPTAQGAANTILRNDGSGNLSWVSLPTSYDGYVVGPASATDNAIARYDGTTGKLIQNSVATLSDTGWLDLGADGYISIGSNPADTGAVRLSNNTGIWYEAASPGTDLRLIASDSSNNVIVAGGSAPIVTFYSSSYSTFITNTVETARVTQYSIDIRGGLALGLYDADSNAYVALRAPATVTGSYTMYMPPAQGAVNQTFRNDGSGNLSWVTLPTSYDGYVVGPASATDNALARYDGTTGKLIQNSVATLSDTGILNLGSGGRFELGASPSTAGWIRLPYGGSLFTRNSTNTADIRILLQNNNDLYIGQSTTIVRINNGATNGETIIGDGYISIGKQGQFLFYDSDSSNYIGLRAPSTVSANLTFTLPGTDGTSGQVLYTDASGVLGWKSIPTAYDGYVVGPASATDNAIARYDGTTGKLLQDSLVSVGDTGNIAIRSTATNPIFYQADDTTASATGDTLTVRAQNATGTTSIGGSLILTSGTGTTAGRVYIQTGGVTVAAITPSTVSFDCGTNVSTFGDGSLSIASAGTDVASTGVIRLTSTGSIVANNVGGTADINMISVGSDIVNIGDSSFTNARTYLYADDVIRGYTKADGYVGIVIQKDIVPQVVQASTTADVYLYERIWNIDVNTTTARTFDYDITGLGDGSYIIEWEILLTASSTVHFKKYYAIWSRRSGTLAYGTSYLDVELNASGFTTAFSAVGNNTCRCSFSLVGTENTHVVAKARLISSPVYGA